LRTLVASEAAPDSDRAPPDVGIDPWVRTRRDAALLGDGRMGSLLWIDDRCQAYGMFGLDPWWIGAFGAYYASGKPVMVCRKGLRGGGSASACRALVRCALFTERDLDPGTVGVIPIMSATRDEANDRFVTIMAILRACGIAPARNSDDEGNQAARGGVDGIYKSTKSQAGGGLIQTLDSQGHKIEFRILPVLLRHAVGYTGIAGFLDESDLWPDDPDRHMNPATEVFDTIGERFTTQPQAELLIFSASYKARSAHSKLVADGDTPLQHVSRLGIDGAQRDNEARAMLAESTGDFDPKLTASADPMSPDIPAWVSNPSKSQIATCYLWSKQRIGRMLGRYGGRAAENADEQAHPDTLATVAFPIDEATDQPFRYHTKVIGVSMGDELWGIVCVGAHADGFTVLADGSGRYASSDACAGIVRNARNMFAAVITPHGQVDAIRSELQAHMTSTSQVPICTTEVAHNGDLRTGPLRTLYMSGRLAHLPGLTDLESDARAHTPDTKRAPRIEALAAAVAYLTACYPWLGAQQEAIRGGRAYDSALGSGGLSRHVATLRSLGAKVGPGEAG